MLCNKCGKNMAVVFLQNKFNPNEPPRALCIKCAREEGVKEVDNIIKSMGLDPDRMEKDMDELFENIDPQQLEDGVKEMMESMKDGNGMFTLNPTSSQDEVDDDDSEKKFNPANMIGKFFGMNKPADGEEKPAANAKTEKKDEKNTLKKRKTLESFGVNLTRRAKNGEIDKVIGRDNEIARIIQILNRRTKNNPVLLGEPGVGKTAIAEGLAMRIANKEVPAKLIGYEIYLIDFAAIVAGTQFRGQFEARLKKLIEEAKNEGNIILVIDEIHNIVGAGEAEGGAMSAANILKPALARGEVQIIGATTLNEYRKKIEKDSALERRFQHVFVEEPSVEDSIEIIKGIREYYEEYHKVRLSDEVIKSAVIMSERYIHDRFLPDKAIDVIDEASSKVNLSNTTLTEISKIADLRREANIKLADTADDDYQTKADIKSELCRLDEREKTLKENFEYIPVTADDVAQVIEMWTKIPVQKLTSIDGEKLLTLEKSLHKRVIGQDEAITSVAGAVRRKRAGISSKKRPVSFIFVGPTGVGKTELVKALAESVFGSEEALIRVDMSEYMEKHSVSKLIGSPPGYVGYDEAGQLTEKVRRNPYSLILLDEIEKAHPDVFNIFLQVLDDGRITDSQGRVVNFENTIIVMTSNAGSDYSSASSMGFETSKFVSKYEKALNQLFRPEFINRIDRIIEFKPLTKEELVQIADLLIKDITSAMEEKGFAVTVTDKAKEFIAERGFDKKFGARPMRRAITKYIEDELAHMLISGSIPSGAAIEITAENDNIKINI